MDKTGLNCFGYGRTAVLICAVLFAGACASPPPKKTAVAPERSPLPPEAERVEKPVNVSFSTYSKEWPVGWQWIDPGERDLPTPKDVKKGILRVRIPTGKDLRPDNTTSPRYVKPISGDFEIETRVRFLPKENYQGAGLLIYQDDRNFLRFERAYGGSGGGGEGLRVDVRAGGEFRSLLTPDDAPTSADEIDLKIIRDGAKLIAYWRVDEESGWREAVEFDSGFPETVYAGLVMSNTAREIVAEFDFIRLLPKNRKAS